MSLMYIIAIINDVAVSFAPIESFDGAYQNLHSSCNKETGIKKFIAFNLFFILYSTFKMSLTKADPNKQGWEDSVSSFDMTASMSL